MKRLLLMLLATISLIACDKGGDDTPKSIELTNDTKKEQTVYADDTQKSESIKFKALSEWTASVNEVSSRADDNDAWLKLSAYNGKAGNVALSLTITPNKTGADRKAEIRILCGEDTITITITQKATNNPDPEQPEQPGTISFISADGKVKGGEIFGTQQPTALSWKIYCPDYFRSSTTTYPYSNKSFDITLPIPNANELGELFSPEANITISPSDAKFAWSEIGFVNCGIIPSNREKDMLDEDYDAKKGDGMVAFVYASKSVTFNGTVTDEQKTYKLTNCQLRQGWNEMVMITAEDAAADGSVVINITANNTPADFKWVVVKGTNIPEEPEVVRNYVTKINDQLIEYHNDFVFLKIGDVSYVNKCYSETEWAYVSKANAWCGFTYENGKVAYTTYNDTYKTRYEWDGGELTSIYDVDYNLENTKGMRLDIEYGRDRTYGFLNIDINWLVAHSNKGNMSFMTPYESAIGVRSIHCNNLISKISQTDFWGDNKYTATFTYRYVINERDQLTHIYETPHYFGQDNPAEERLLYKLEYSIK